MGQWRKMIHCTGRYSRGYLPHFDSPDVIQAITFRLADSLPREKLRQLEQELALVPELSRDINRRKQIEQWLDAGMGCCALRHPQMAKLMQETLLRLDPGSLSLDRLVYHA